MGKNRVDAGRGGKRPDVVKKAARKSKAPFYTALIVIAIVGIGALALVASRSGADVITVDPNMAAGSPEGYLLGSPDAPVQVIEFADFECPACAQFFAVTEPDVRKRLIDQGTISFRFYDFPLEGHRNTWHASMAAACASDQGKFWEMHDAIFETQDVWNGQATDRPKSVFETAAQRIGLDVAQWEECYDSRKHLGRIEANRREAERRRVPSTPTFIIGDKMIPGALGYDRFKAYVDSALAARGAVVGRDSAAKGAAADSAAKAARP